ncbi:hypothetical protein [Mucilaginibacter kameinonensis]|uniref:hypothetical protein n=1 Tax=Mucilaginibacter kameinonensis TaxID=452286 RepID=UPI000EF7EF21|nr:hypothetical protein [Mucilaginibacter kameinonensis]
MENFISYSGLPISSGGAHKVNGRSALDIYDSLSHFTSNLTNADKPSRLTLEFESTDDNNARIIWKLILAFGLPKLSLSNYIGTRRLIWYWTLRTGSINKAIKLQQQNQNITFSVLWCFYFTDLQSKQAIPGQETIPIIDPRLYNSQIYWRVGKTSTISLWFTLPFKELDTPAINYIKLLQANLPVKLSSHHWRLWRNSKTGPSPKKLNCDFLA